MYAFMARNLITRKNILFVLIILTILNLVNLFTTLVSLRSGLYEELNMIIKFLYLQSPIIMAIYKIFIPLIPFLFLFKYGKSIQLKDYNQMSNKEKVKTVVISSIFLAVIWSTIFYVFVAFHNFLLTFFGISI